MTLLIERERERAARHVELDAAPEMEAQILDEPLDLTPKASAFSWMARAVAAARSWLPAKGLRALLPSRPRM